MTDVAITAASVQLVSGPVEYGVLGAAATAGQWVYKDAATLTFKLADTNDATAAVRQAYGMLLNGGAIGQPCAVAKPGAVVNVGGTLVVGGVYVLSATPGGLAPVADLATGHYTSTLGIALTAANLSVQIQNGGVARP